MALGLFISKNKTQTALNRKSWLKKAVLKLFETFWNKKLVRFDSFDFFDTLF